MRISDWSSDVCSSDLCCRAAGTRCDEPADRRLEPRVGGERARRGGGARRTCGRDERGAAQARRHLVRLVGKRGRAFHRPAHDGARRRLHHRDGRSEEHTSELQSLMRISYAVFCLKKKKQNKLKESDIMSMIQIKVIAAFDNLIKGQMKYRKTLINHVSDQYLDNTQHISYHK